MKAGYGLLTAVVALGTLPAAAQEMQRCEGPGGKVSYAQGACPPGTTAVRTLPPATTPSSADQKAAQQRAQQDLRNAAALDKARKADEERIAREQEKAAAAAKKQEVHCRRLDARLRQARDELDQSPQARRAEAQRRVGRAQALYVEDCGPLKP
jgi:hypothetical protein